jgi:hypothetical protein
MVNSEQQRAITSASRIVAAVSNIAISPTNDRTFEAARAAAHAQGRWLTAELKNRSVATVSTARKAMAIPAITCPQPCGLPTPNPGAYTTISRTVSAAKAHYTGSILNSDLSSISTGTMSASTKYDLQVNYSDGTSSIALTIQRPSGALILARLNPDGSVRYIQFGTCNCSDQGSNNSDWAGDQYFSPTLFGGNGQGSQYDGAYSIWNPWSCAAVTGAGGIAVGAVAEILLPVKGPWTWRLGTYAGATMTGFILWKTGSCWKK